MPRVGPPAGWPPHTSVENSREIIRTVFAGDAHSFGMILKETGRLIGTAGFVGGDHGTLPETEDEIGYALSPAYWGRGLVPEAVRELLRYGFEELGLTAIWCGHYDFNAKSRRVVEKCGFIYRFTNETYVERMGETRTELHYALTKKEWQAL